VKSRKVMKRGGGVLDMFRSKSNKYLVKDGAATSLETHDRQVAESEAERKKKDLDTLYTIFSEGYHYSFTGDQHDVMHDATLYYVEATGVEEDKSFTCKFVLIFYDVTHNIMIVSIKPRVHVKNVGWELECRPTIADNQFILTPIDGNIKLLLTTWTNPEDIPQKSNGEREESRVYKFEGHRVIHTKEGDETRINIKKIIISEETMRGALEKYSSKPTSDLSHIPQFLQRH